MIPYAHPAYRHVRAAWAAGYREGIADPRQRWTAAYRWQRRSCGGFVTPDDKRIQEQLRRLFAKPRIIRGRMASGKPATILTYRWEDMR